MIRLYKIKDYNFILVLLLAMISVMGILLVGSANADLQSRQIGGVVFGFLVMIGISLIDYSWLLHFYLPVYLVNLGLLFLVIIFGVTRLGAARWITIGGFQFQPTELSKILLILFFSMYFMIHKSELSTWRRIFRSLLYLGLPLFMILNQPDLKNTITMTIVFSCMYFAAGLSYRKIGLIVMVIVPLVVGAVFLIVKTDLPIIDDYQKKRVMTFLNPEDDEYSESAMQQQNSVMAIGSGRFSGKGLNNNEVSTANKGNFVAEIQNDFIFAVAGEELGFAGCIGIVVLLFLIIFQCFQTGKRAKDKAGSLFCYGIGTLIAVQSFINISVATGILPNTGTTLPFVSYGLTSLVSLFIGMGIVLNISLQRKQYYDYGGEYIYEGETYKPEET
uniref:FtsW/RodA/SpoVE family cell cycle protein n=1 Tax=Eubacterium cellulosolvens TaxID=29322 RepID=UPI00054F4856|nr:FtsW/RodA/SpoVE family cell cycle protein [[Eubacterium] cellulosolvens]